MRLSLKRVHSDSYFSPGRQLSALWLFEVSFGTRRHELRNLFQYVLSPLCFLLKKMAAVKRMKKVGKNTGDHFNVFLLSCLQNLEQNVLPAWMGPRELVCSCFFLPVSLLCSLVPLCQEPPTFTARWGPRQ